MNAKEFINMVQKENDRLWRSYKLLMLRIKVREYLFEQKRGRDIPEIFFELAISELLQRDITYNTWIKFPVRWDDEKQRKINDNELLMAFHQAEMIIKNSNITIL